MPAKGRRMAVRQAELRSRRRRPAPAAPAADTTPPAAGVATADRASAGASSQPAGSPAAPAAPAMSRGASGAAPRRSVAQARGERVSAYGYVGAEMRRIFIVTMVVVAILAALTFLLK